MRSTYNIKMGTQFRGLSIVYVPDSTLTVHQIRTCLANAVAHPRQV